MLGERVAARGLRIVLSPNVVETVVAESSFRSLWWRELRWARTIRAMQPLGYAFSFVTYAVPLALLHLLVSPSRPDGWLPLAAAAGLRVWAHLRGETGAGRLRRPSLGGTDPRRAVFRGVGLELLRPEGPVERPGNGGGARWSPPGRETRDPMKRRRARRWCGATVRGLARHPQTLE